MKKPRDMLFGFQTRSSVKPRGLIIEKLPRAPKHKAEKVVKTEAAHVPLDPEEFVKRLLVEDAVILDYLAK